MVWSRGCPLEVAGWHCSMHGPWHNNHDGSQAAGKQQQQTNNTAHLRGCPAVLEMLEVMLQDTCCQNRATGDGPNEHCDSWGWELRLLGPNAGWVSLC